jgi:hypothetical protein
MPNLTNVTATRDGTTVRVTGKKGPAVKVRAYLNPDLFAYPTNEALFDGYDHISTPKAQDVSTSGTFDLSLAPATGPTQSLNVVVVSKDGKLANPPVENTPISFGTHAG